MLGLSDDSRHLPDPENNYALSVWITHAFIQLITNLLQIQIFTLCNKFVDIYIHIYIFRAPFITKFVTDYSFPSHFIKWRMPRWNIPQVLSYMCYWRTLNATRKLLYNKQFPPNTKKDRFHLYEQYSGYIERLAKQRTLSTPFVKNWQ